MLHYLWIFITEFGTLILYAFLYAHLRSQVKMASRNGISTGALSRVAHAQRYMLLYPAIYLCLTLPLAIGRMITSAQGHVNETYLLVAGSLFCSVAFSTHSYTHSHVGSSLLTAILVVKTILQIAQPARRVHATPMIYPGMSVITRTSRILHVVSILVYS